MSDNSLVGDPVGMLADSFVERYRRGERPSLTEYCERYPELADRIRELFPALVMMEELAPEAGESISSSVASPGSLPRNLSGTRLEQVGDYRILREIGRGGMGVVYEAEQLSLDRHVALKVLPIHAARNTKALERFRREARAAARLHHSNIVPVFDVGQDHDICFYAMQFIQGQSLDEVLAELKRMRSLQGTLTTAEKTGGAEVAANASQSAPDAESAADVARALVSGRFRAPTAVVEAIDDDADNDHCLSHPTHPVDKKQCDDAVQPDHLGPASTKSHEPCPQFSPEKQQLSDASRPMTVASHLSVISSDTTNLSSVSQSNPQHFYRRVARIGMDIAEALAYAHDRGVVHRDIKPSNILLDAIGTVWVTDFGLAKTEGEDLTHTGDLVGTLRYMAPERFRGHGDSRSDVYGLGVTIYELLTLEPAFDSPDRLQLIQQVTHGDPRRPRKLDSRIPRDLETIVSKAIDKEPTRRYASAADMAADLQRFLADRPIFARRSAVWERTWRLCRRNPIVSGLTAAVVALAAVLGATALVMQLVRTQRDRAIVHLDRAIEAERLANVNLARAERAEREVRIRSHLTQAVAHRRRGEMGRRVHSVREIDLALGLATDPSPELKHELRNELIANLALTDLWPAKTWEAAGTKMEMDAAFEKYARATLDGVVSVRRVADDSEIIRLERPPISDARISLKFSRDGRYLATFSYDHKLLVCQLDGGRTVVIPGCNSEQAYDFTPDSRRIICGQGDELIVYDLVTGAAESHWPTKIAPWCVVTSPVGEMVAISSHPDGRPHMQVHSSLTGQLISQWAPPAGLYSMVWRPDGKVLGLGRQDGTLSLWDVEQAKPQREIKQVGKYAALAFSHGGDLLASYSSGTVRLWEPMSGNVLMAGTVGMRSLRFSSDDRYLGLFDDGAKVGIFEVLRSDIHRHVARGIGDRDGNPISASFNRDGDLFAVGTPNGFGLWDFASGRQLAHAPIGYVEQMWFEDSGDLVTASKGPSAHILNRWPVRREQGEGRCVKVGPPKQLPMLSPNICSATRDGRVIATAVTDGAMVYYSDRPQEPIKIGPHWDCRNVAVSPDGQWVATGSHWGAKVKVWRARTAELVATLPIETSSWVHFSPDGRWLTTTGGGCRIWKVPSWEEGPAIDGGVAVFSPDGTLLVTNRYHALRLIHPDTGREIVRLEDPNGSVAWQYAFTHDGTSLFAITNSTCWDLRRIREELTARNLDFDLPPYAPRVLGARVTDQVDLTWAHDVKGSAEEQMRLAIEQYRRNYESSPNNPNACNNLAWFLVTAPEPLRDVELAVRLSEKAATANTSPFKSTYRNTLGVAYYRSGRYEEAASCLEANLADQSDSDLPYDLFFLAMSHQQLGHTARARELFIMAKRWFTREMQRDTLSHQQIEELTRFCSEAELVLGAAPARLESP